MKTYKRFRFPSQVISHAIWLYHRFSLSFRDIEEILASRGVLVSYESIRQWCLKLAPTFVKKLKKRQRALGELWFLDEVFIKINGKLHYLWRAVDQDGCELDILVTKRRNKHAAIKFFRKLFKGQVQQPRRIVTDKLRSYTPLRWGNWVVKPRMAQSNMRTTSLKYRTKRHASNNDKCASLNRLVRHNVSWYVMVRLIITLGSKGICLKLITIGYWETDHSNNGPRLRVPRV